MARHCYRCATHWQFSNRFGAQRIHLHGSHDVFDALLAPVLEGVGELVADLIAHHPRDADAARFRQTFQSCGHIDAIAEDVVLLNDHVAEIDPNAEGEALILGRFGVALGHAALDLNGTTHRIDHAWKFSEKAIAGILYRMTAVLLDLRINELPEMSLEPFVRPLLIRPHQARVPRHIGGEDCSEAADSGHGAPVVNGLN